MSETRTRRLQAEIDATWQAIENAYDIEPRAYFEREAPHNGFVHPLVQALHHIWKREPKVQPLLDRVAALEKALREVDEELWNNGGQDVAYLRDRIASALTPQPAKEDA